MIFKDTEFILKDGRKAILRSPCEGDAEEMLRFITQASGETDFLLRYPEEFDGFPVEKEKAFIRGNCDNPNGMMILCLVPDRHEGMPPGFRRHRPPAGILESRNRDKDV